jgi:hypothetical protein
MVVHICNPSYSGGGDQEIKWFEASPDKKLGRPPSDNNKLDMVVHACDPHCFKSLNRRIMFRPARA